MWARLLLVLLILPSSISAEDFSIFKKNGKFGIKDAEGHIAVPAIYEKLGWSDGSSNVLGDVIGFKKNSSWGLLSIKNKVIRPATYYSVQTVGKDYILASVKGKFSNQLFHGILKSNGEVVISFHYSEIVILNNYFKAGIYDRIQTKYGLLNEEDRIIIPFDYSNIEMRDGWTLARRFDSSLDIFRNGKSLVSELDSVKVDNGLVCIKKGYEGFLDADGVLKYPLVYKRIDLTNNSPIPFPLWEVMGPDELRLETACDSLRPKEGLWHVYRNGIPLIFDAALEKEILVGEISRVVDIGRYIIKDQLRGKWILMDGEKRIIQNYDTLYSANGSFLGRKGPKWDLFNSFGRKVNRFPLAALTAGSDKQFLAKRNNYWGVLGFDGSAYVSFKYDSIVTASNNLYHVKFLNKWGAIDRHGNWKIKPRFDEIMSFGNIQVGRKGYSYTYFNGEITSFQSTAKPNNPIDDFLLIQDENGKQGVLNRRASLIIPVEYDIINRTGDFFILRDGSYTELRDLNGKVILSQEDNIEELGYLSEGYLAFRKNKRWGFLDSEGTLRIANRYKKVGSFSEGLAPVMLRNKWGFLDIYENLRVQPHYDQVSSFRAGMAIVKSKELFGVIDNNGNEVLSMKWKNIHRLSTGNYLVEDARGKLGLADKKGLFLLRPDFDSLKDLGGKVIIESNGRKGVLDYQGNQLIDIQYAEVLNDKGFLLLMN